MIEQTLLEAVAWKVSQHRRLRDCTCRLCRAYADAVWENGATPGLSSQEGDARIPVPAPFSESAVIEGRT